ncbi:CWF19-like protein 1 [Dysidea avara]|uniref:CWF19-like protein 1 n=1 Tax=Dysidea avara TaxID=196820 RepID=UPI00332AAE07
MKILVAGDVEGRFEQLFTRVANIQKKSGQFDMLLCVGTFFSSEDECKSQWRQMVEGTITVPLPTYIMGPTSKDHMSYYGDLDSDGGELIDDITFLGQAGVFTTSSDLRIAYLSGRHDENSYSSTTTGDKSLSENFNQSDVERLFSHAEKKDYVGVDILLSSDWPSDVAIGTNPPDGVDISKVGCQPLSRLATALKPRYHFVSLHKVFYERPPYRNHRVLQEPARHCTRFISLANVGNPDKKQRFLYAFNITPMASMEASELTAQPQASTDCPYVRTVANYRQHSQASSGDPSQNFFYDERAIASSKRKHQNQRGNDPKRRAPDWGKPPVAKGPCWFCLGSPEVDKHLVVSVGEQSYLALPKGGLTPEHVLIIPISHYASFTEASRGAMIEMEKYKSSLRKYYHSKGQTCVIFERNYRSQHMQLQVVPVPKMSCDTLREVFVAHGQSQGIEFTELPPGTSIVDAVQAGRSYFNLEFEDPPNLYCNIRGKFPLQFGREVLASGPVLDMTDRVDWKACSVSKEQETKLATNMRENFEPFDFTVDL